jgi:hypothetical protein
MSEPVAPVFTGSCLCGAIRYEARGAPLGVNHCHCVQCQRVSGAALLTWATWPRASLRVLRGEVADFESSPGVKRSFCARCGSTLFWRRVAREREELDVAAGTLDQAEQLRPTEHIFVKSRRPWMPLCDGLPAYAESRPKP